MYIIISKILGEPDAQPEVEVCETEEGSLEFESADAAFDWLTEQYMMAEQQLTQLRADAREIDESIALARKQMSDANNAREELARHL